MIDVVLKPGNETKVVLYFKDNDLLTVNRTLCDLAERWGHGLRLCQYMGGCNVPTKTETSASAEH